MTNHDRRPVVVAERILGRSFYKRRRVVEGLRPPMRRPRRRAASTEQIGRDDAMIRSKHVTEGRPLLVARTAAVDRDDGSSGAPDRVLDAEARRRAEQARPPGDLCRHCRIPMCSDCLAQIPVTAKMRVAAIPVALGQDMFWGYTTDLLHKFQVR